MRTMRTMLTAMMMLLTAGMAGAQVTRAQVVARYADLVLAAAAAGASRINYGDEYRRYARRVGRFLPRVRGSDDPRAAGAAR